MSQHCKVPWLSTGKSKYYGCKWCQAECSDCRCSVWWPDEANDSRGWADNTVNIYIYTHTIYSVTEMYLLPMQIPTSYPLCILIQPDVEQNSTWNCKGSVTPCGFHNVYHWTCQIFPRKLKIIYYPQLDRVLRMRDGLYCQTLVPFMHRW